MKKKYIPFGRIPDYLSTLSEDEKARTAICHSNRIDADSVICTWKTRKLMAKVIRKEEKSAPRSKWDALIALKDSEGY